MKLSGLMTARQVRRQEPLSVRVRYWPGWLKNRIEIAVIRQRLRAQKAHAGYLRRTWIP
jgi:hypothetical protein